MDARGVKSVRTLSGVGRQLVERDRRIAELERQLAERDKRISELVSHVEKLKALLAKNSSNSSLPPSSDGPSGRASNAKDHPKHRKGRKRKRGGQPGHQRNQRPLVLPERVTRTIAHHPDVCAHCDEELTEADCNPKPVLHQIIELPEIEADVTEHQCFTATCLGCGGVTKAVLRDDVQRDAFGPRLKAFVSMLTGKYRLSKRYVPELLADVAGIDVSTGSVCKMEQFVSEALAAPYEEAHAHVQSAFRSHADETPWRQSKKKAWLWVASTLQVVVMTALGRGKAQAKKLLGDDHAGVVHTDRWRGYDWLGTDHRQLCWAHLERNFQGIADRDGGGRRFGRAMVKDAHRLFGLWHRLKEGELQRPTFRRRMERLRARVKRRLQRGAISGVGHVESTCNDLLRLEPAMRTFVYEEGVEPTNNTAERDIRKPVMWRKVSFGTDSERGSRFAERILTASGTLRKQKRNVFSYLTELSEAYQAGAPLPSMLPG